VPGSPRANGSGLILIAATAFHQRCRKLQARAALGRADRRGDWATAGARRA
jgi:hypothetical protein